MNKFSCLRYLPRRRRLPRMLCLLISGVMLIMGTSFVNVKNTDVKNTDAVKGVKYADALLVIGEMEVREGEIMVPVSLLISPPLSEMRTCILLLDILVEGDMQIAEVRAADTAVSAAARTDSTAGATLSVHISQTEKGSKARVLLDGPIFLYARTDILYVVLTPTAPIPAVDGEVTEEDTEGMTCRVTVAPDPENSYIYYWKTFLKFQTPPNINDPCLSCRLLRGSEKTLTVSSSLHATADTAADTMSEPEPITSATETTPQTIEIPPYEEVSVPAVSSEDTVEVHPDTETDTAKQPEDSSKDHPKDHPKDVSPEELWSDARPEPPVFSEPLAGKDWFAFLGCQEQVDADGLHVCLLFELVREGKGSDDLLSAGQNPAGLFATGKRIASYLPSLPPPAVWLLGTQGSQTLIHLTTSWLPPLTDSADTPPYTRLVMTYHGLSPTGTYCFVLSLDGKIFTFFYENAGFIGKEGTL